LTRPGWDSTCSGSSLPTSETYKGSAPESEAETQILIDFSLEKNIVKLLNFHSYGQEVVHSFLCEPIADAVDAFIVDEAIVLAELADYAYRRPSDGLATFYFIFLKTRLKIFFAQTVSTTSGPSKT